MNDNIKINIKALIFGAVIAGVFIFLGWEISDFIYLFAAIGLLYAGYGQNDIKLGAVCGAIASIPIIILTFQGYMGTFDGFFLTGNGMFTLSILIIIVGVVFGFIGALIKNNTTAVEGYDQSILENITTKHIDKNGLSFDYPEYYDIGNCQSSDEAHKSMVGLVKKDRSCEIYITQYWDYAFDNNAKRNNPLLKEYLKLHGYENIRENKQLPYCFNAKINTQLGKIRTTIIYNFNHSNVIMIVCNYYPNSNYNGIMDMAIINGSITLS